MGGEPQTVDQTEVHRIKLAPGSGLPLNVRCVDLVEIGAGGGSIARAHLGTIQVGPESAGSSPGPACYQLGGASPTVTDANLILGYLHPGRFAGGSLTLDVEAASRAVSDKVARRLDISLHEAAWGIHTMVNANMEAATRVVSLERGQDPRTLTLVATGGCAPAHACRLVPSLGIPRVIMPAAAGVASALGLLTAGVRFEVSRSYLTSLRQADRNRVESLYVDMEAEAVRQSTGRAPVSIIREVDLRYVGQGYELTIPFDGMDSVADEFATRYAKAFGMADPHSLIEAVTWRVTAIGEGNPVEFQRAGSTARSRQKLIERRPAYFPETAGFTDTDVFDRYALSEGDELVGPAIVEESGSTSVLPPGFRATVDCYGSLIAELAL